MCVIIVMTPVEIHFMIPDIFMVFSQCIKEIEAFIFKILPILTQSQGSSDDPSSLVTGNLNSSLVFFIGINS